MRAKLLCVTAATAALLFAVSAAAQLYPAKPIRLIVPYPPGGSTDIIGRIIGQKMSDLLGRPIVVDNRPGAGTTIGTEAVVRAAPDGYTILMGSFANAVSKSLFPSLSFDPSTDLVGVAQISKNAIIMTVSRNLPADSVQAFIRLARAQPGKLNYGAGGAGSSAHLAAELFKTLAGVDVVPVLYKGGAAALQDLMRGDVHLIFDSPQTVVPLAQARKVKILAVTSRARSPALPHLPTVDEAGVPGFAIYAWFGILAPAKTPAEVVRTLESTVIKAVGLPDVQARFTALGIEPIGSTAQEFSKFRAPDMGWLSA